MTGHMNGLPRDMETQRPQNIILYVLMHGKFPSRGLWLMGGRDNHFTWAKRWAFIFRDEENAWRFARFVDKSFYREERFERKFMISARVMN